MVIEAAAVGAAAPALWSYNRSNFLFDRKQRQEQEFTILEYRTAQAEQWREDVRDIIELTERKMDNYLIISTLELGMCMALLSEGRLQPTTPPWLLNFYMLALGAAFMYLLMSVWLAMHATVTARCSSVRLLTQFVRLPVPSWEQLEEMRTYARSFESVHVGHAFRIPFTSSLAGVPEGEEGPVPHGGAGAATEQDPLASAAGAPSEDGGLHADPWLLEQHGDLRELYELYTQPAALRRHILLARRAAEQFQCYDAFARVAMTFGTNQLLSAIAYYCLGYVAVQDGAKGPAWCVVLVMAAIGNMMMHLDFSLRFWEQARLFIFATFTLLCAAAATHMHVSHQDLHLNIVLPLVYASQAVWLGLALHACGLQKQANGAVLPMKFRAILYLDVFGWLSKGVAESRDIADWKQDTRSSTPEARAVASPSPSRDSEDVRIAKVEAQIRRDVHLWQSPVVRNAMDDHDRQKVDRLAKRVQGVMSAADLEPVRSHSASTSTAATPDAETPERPVKPEPPLKDGGDMERGVPVVPVVKLKGYSDFGVEVPYLLDPHDGSVHHLAHADDHLPVASGRAVRTISSFQERIEQYCEEAGDQYCEEAAGDPAPSASPSSLALSPSVAEAADSPDADLGCAQLPLPPKPGLASPVIDAMKALMCSELESGIENEYTPLVSVSEMDTTAGGPTTLGATTGFMTTSTFRRRGSKTGSSWDPATPMSPSGEVPEPPAQVFKPASYSPFDDPDEPIVTGHDRIHPGRVPSKVFRHATALLLLLWCLGFLLSIFPCTFDSIETFVKPLTESVFVEEVDAATGRVEKEAKVEAVIGTNPNGLPELISMPAEERPCPELQNGEQLIVDWPQHAAFVPRALSSDPTGGRLVVADDFGIYLGQTFGSTTGHLWQGGGPMQVKFHSIRTCASLEGQTIRDISVVCSKPPGDELPLDGGPRLELRHCSVIVMTDHGHVLNECPLLRAEPKRQEAPQDQQRALASAANLSLQEWRLAHARKLTAAKQQEVERALLDQAKCRSWVLPGKWLHPATSSRWQEEKVAAFTVNDECFSKDLGSCGQNGGTGFRPQPHGCFVAGTTGGRLVALGAATADAKELVPRRLVHQESSRHPLSRGSLSILPGGVVIALWSNTSKVVAFNQTSNVEIGSWRLPPSFEWLMLCSGGGSLFVLGVRGGESVEIYRFPLPEALLARGNRDRGPRFWTNEM